MALQAETVIPDLRQEQQTRADWYVEPYSPFNFGRLNQLHITLDKNAVKVGETLNFKLHLNTFSEKERSHLQHVSYIVSQTHCYCLLFVFFFLKSRIHSRAYCSLPAPGVE